MLHSPPGRNGSQRRMRLQQPRQLGRRQVGRRAAADEDRPHRLRFAERRHLRVEGVEVQLDEMILTDSDGEVAIAALVGAERNVDIGGARPDPRRCFVHDGVSRWFGERRGVSPPVLGSTPGGLRRAARHCIP